MRFSRPLTIYKRLTEIVKHPTNSLVYEILQCWRYFTSSGRSEFSLVFSSAFARMQLRYLGASLNLEKHVLGKRTLIGRFLKWLWQGKRHWVLIARYADISLFGEVDNHSLNSTTASQIILNYFKRNSIITKKKKKIIHLALPEIS